MTTFEVVYYFRCTVCWKVNVGSVHVVAETPENAVNRLVVACHYCCPLSVRDGVGEAFVFDNSSSGMGA
jgi:hypothetical protein